MIHCSTKTTAFNITLSYNIIALSHQYGFFTGLQISVYIFISIMPSSSPNPMFDHLLESSHRDDSNKWSNIGFGEELTQVEFIKVYFMHLIMSSVYMCILLSGHMQKFCSNLRATSKWPLT